jgi:hypothetical protein
MIRAARTFSSSAALLAAFVALFALSTASFAQAPAGLEAEKAERQRQLEVLRGELDHAKDSEARLKSEIDLIKDDREARKRCSTPLRESAWSKPGSRRPRSACPSSTKAKRKSNPRSNPAAPCSPKFWRRCRKSATARRRH